MLRKIIITALFFMPLFLAAQNNPLVIEGAAPNFYISHTVGPKENFYSIGRLYNVSPSLQIAPFNKLQMENGLSIGQIIKIPLAETNFSQNGIMLPDEALIPLYYMVRDKETLFHVSTVNNKVPIASLKKWNKLSGESISPGKLIIGYLKVKKDVSALASKAVRVESINTEPLPPVSETKKKTEDQPQLITVTEKKETDIAKVSTVPAKESDNVSGKTLSGGYFKALFDKQTTGKGKLAEETGTAGVFKSTSGWEDGKYYCLHNTAPSGTIIKVTNNATQKSVYAKVLDVIPDLKQNNGLILRISNAAADELGAGNANFECTIRF
jgi:hypothetical protein